MKKKICLITCLLISFNIFAYQRLGDYSLTITPIDNYTINDIANTEYLVGSNRTVYENLNLIEYKGSISLQDSEDVYLFGGAIYILPTGQIRFDFNRVFTIGDNKDDFEELMKFLANSIMKDTEEYVKAKKDS